MAVYAASRIQNWISGTSLILKPYAVLNPYAPRLYYVYCCRCTNESDELNTQSTAGMLFCCVLLTLTVFLLCTVHNFFHSCCIVYCEVLFSPRDNILVVTRELCMLCVYSYLLAISYIHHDTCPLRDKTVQAQGHSPDGHRTS